MGFQIANIAYRVDTTGSFAGIFSAGADQTLICAQYAHLDAIVSGDDITSHETLWEQTSGSAITWIGDPANSLSISYENMRDRTDRTFRFWIDKGTEFVEHADITVYGTITDVGLIGSIVSPLQIDDNSSNGNAVPFSAYSVTMAPPQYEVADIGEFIQQPINWLQWTFATQDVSTLLYTEVFENSTGAWVLVAQIPSGDQQIYRYANLNYSYRVDAVYNRSRVLQRYLGKAFRTNDRDEFQIVDRISTILVPTINVAQTITTTTRSKITVPLDEVTVIQSTTSVMVESVVIYTTRTKTEQYGTELLAPIPFPGKCEITSTVTVRTRLQVGG